MSDQTYTKEDMANAWQQGWNHANNLEFGKGWGQDIDNSTRDECEMANPYVGKGTFMGDYNAFEDEKPEDWDEYFDKEDES